MKTKSNKYWRNRAKERMNAYHRNSDKTIRIITKAYDKAVKDIEEDVKGIFDKFTRDGELSPEVAKKMLNEKVSNKELDEIRGIAYTTEDKEIKKYLISRLNAQAYKARITRLEALKEKAYVECKRIADVEIQASERQYIDTINEAYYRNMFDIHKGLGIGFDFASIPTKTIEQILKNPWSGKHFSSRVWKNTDILAEKLTEIITSGLMSGKSYYQMAKELEEYTEYGKYAAMRLIRTESTYMANMAEVESYKECEIEKYIYVATLDLRTSEMCQELDRKIFKVSQAEPGKNLPPMHPNCRSTTRSYISEEELKKIKRRARDPKTGKTYLVPANMNYKEWYQKYVVDKHGQDQAKVMKKKITNKSSDKREYEKYKNKVKEWKVIQREYLKENPQLRRDYRREKIYKSTDKDIDSPEFLKVKDTSVSNKDTVKAIQDELKLVPEEHRNIIKDSVNEIVVVENGNSRYNREEGIVYILKNPEKGEVIHELGHAIETKLELYQDDEFLGVLYNGLENVSLDDIVYDIETYSSPIMMLKTDKFISEYQGRLYEDAEIFNDDMSVNLKAMGEYFSEGYREFVMNPENLSKKDENLFNFIKGII